MSTRVFACVCVLERECLDVLFQALCVSVWLCARVNVCTLWRPHLSLSMSSLVCIYPPSNLTGDLDGHWWDHASWHSSEASPMSLVRHVEPCVDPPSLPPAPLTHLSLSHSLSPSLSFCLSLSSPPSPVLPESFCHFMFPLFYLHLCMLFFLFFLSVFIPHL